MVVERLEHRPVEGVGRQASDPSVVAERGVERAPMPSGRADQAVLSATVTRLVVGLLAPLAAFALALWLVDPHLTAAATILIVVFGALSVGRAANGWMSATPFAATRTIATAVGGVVVATFAYVGGIALFEGFVVDAVPYEVPAAVGPVWVAAVLAAIGTGVVVVAFTPGPRGDALRRGAYAWLLSTSTPVSVIRPTSPTSPPPIASSTSGTSQPKIARYLSTRRLRSEFSCAR
jgi:hypothetical protein